MSIQIAWDNDEHTIIRYDYSPGWTWEEFLEAGETSAAMMNTVGHTVHVIANFADGAFPPMNAMARFRVAQESLPKQTVVVVVGGGMFINSLVSTFSRIYRTLSKNLMVANSLQDARVKIAALRTQA